MFVDMVSSSNYRVLRGAKEGYVRGELFFSLVGKAIAPNIHVHIVKEMGDAVFATAGSLRPLLETALVIDLAAHQISTLDPPGEIPFAVRTGISFGSSKRLKRDHDDYLGTPIDELARIMAVGAPSSNLLLQEQAYQAGDDIMQEYSGVLSVGQSMLVPKEVSKGALRSIYYRAVAVDRPALQRYEDHFDPWRRSPLTTQS
jgi:class 3 adenylate cyclase